jgi:ATP/maltotriose-dependent transcriptional regulator MalT
MCHTLVDGWLARDDLGARSRTRAHLLESRGSLILSEEAPASPMEWFSEALDIFRELGDSEDIMETLGSMSFGSQVTGDLHGARAANDEHLALARASQDSRQEALALINAGSIAGSSGDVNDQRNAYEAALIAVRRQDGLVLLEASVLDHLAGLIWTLDGDAARARKLHEEVRAVREAVGDKRNLPFPLISLAQIDRALGELDKAESNADRALSISRSIGLPTIESMVLLELGRIDLCRDDLAGAHRHLHEALVLLRDAGHLPESSEAFDLFAELALNYGDAPSAARFLCAAANALAARGDSVDCLPDLEANRDALQARVSALLDAADRDRLCAETSALSIEQAFDLAIAWQPPKTAAVPPPPTAAHDRLSPRELDVLRLLAEGRSNQEIADALFLSLRTVTTHVTGILSKLDLTSRTQAVAYAIRNGIA